MVPDDCRRDTFQFHPLAIIASYSIKCNVTMPSMASTVISCTQSKKSVIHPLYVKG